MCHIFLLRKYPTYKYYKKNFYLHQQIALIFKLAVKNLQYCKNYCQNSSRNISDIQTIRAHEVSAFVLHACHLSLQKSYPNVAPLTNFNFTKLVGMFKKLYKVISQSVEYQTFSLTISIVVLFRVLTKRHKISYGF